MLSALLGEAQHVGQNLVDKRLGDVGDGVDPLAAALLQALHQRRRLGVERLGHLGERARRQGGTDDCAH